MDMELTPDERTTLSVLAFLFYRMQMDERARRIYEALAELSPAESSDRRFAKAGLAAVAIEAGDADLALDSLKEAMSGRPLSTKDANLYLLKARALWLAGRQDEAKAARDEFLHLAAGGGAAPGLKA